jgi:hypothetical protein
MERPFRRQVFHLKEIVVAVKVLHRHGKQAMSFADQRPIDISSIDYMA